MVDINSDSKITKIIPAKKDKAAPGALAERLAKAKAAFEAERAAVIDAGAQRMQDIAALQVELAREQSALDAVVTEAKQ